MHVPDAAARSAIDAKSNDRSPIASQSCTSMPSPCPSPWGMSIVIAPAATASAAEPFSSPSPTSPSARVM